LGWEGARGLKVLQQALQDAQEPYFVWLEMPSHNDKPILAIGLSEAAIKQHWQEVRQLRKRSARPILANRRQ
jgi:hypothetical protein